MKNRDAAVAPRRLFEDLRCHEVLEQRPEGVGTLAQPLLRQSLQVGHQPAIRNREFGRFHDSSAEVRGPGRD